MAVNLRVYIRTVCNRLCKHFKNFVDKMAEVGVVQNRLSLFEIRQRNNEHEVPCRAHRVRRRTASRRASSSTRPATSRTRRSA